MSSGFTGLCNRRRQAARRCRAKFWCVANTPLSLVTALLLALWAPAAVRAQDVFDPPASRDQWQGSWASEAVSINGALDEAVWRRTRPSTQSVQKAPDPVARRLLTVSQLASGGNPAALFGVFRDSRSVAGQSRLGGTPTRRRDHSLSYGSSAPPSNDRFTYSLDALWRLNQRNEIDGLQPIEGLSEQLIAKFTYLFEV